LNRELNKGHAEDAAKMERKKEIEVLKGKEIARYGGEEEEKRQSDSKRKSKRKQSAACNNTQGLIYGLVSEREALQRGPLVKFTIKLGNGNSNKFFFSSETK